MACLQIQISCAFSDKIPENLLEIWFNMNEKLSKNVVATVIKVM